MMSPILTFPVKIEYELSRFVKPLIEQLGSESFGEREEATEKLLMIGRDVIPDLQELVRGDDAESVILARTIIESLQSQ